MGPGLVYLAEPNKTKVSSQGKTANIEFGATSMQGWRKNMEDAHCTIVNYGGDPTACLFGVFDGHGGTAIVLCNNFNRKRSGRVFGQTFTRGIIERQFLLNGLL